MVDYSTIDFELPIEVQLAWEVMTCRGMRSTYEQATHSCSWFNKNYGPYPAYDWIAHFPPGVPERGKNRLLDVVCKGARFQVPELMSGCRKAPIMTIGINPNLTAFWPSRAGATWCYPYFDNIGQYAYYFRHRSVFQERFSLGFIVENVDPQRKIVALQDGRIKKAGTPDKNTYDFTLVVKYEEGPAAKDVEILLKRGNKVFYDPPWSSETIFPGETNNFKSGDIIAGEVNLPEGVNTSVYQETVGYYDRFQDIFDIFKQHEHQKLPVSVDLRMAEDVCQADMVACASPGWKSWISDDDIRSKIVDECVIKRMWIGLQLLQTRPTIIVFAGKSAFELFHNLLGDAIVIKPDITCDSDKPDIILLKKTIDNEYHLNVNLDEISFSSRIIISPHFSYQENFYSVCIFTTDEWERFKTQHAGAAEVLTKNTRHTVNNDYTVFQFKKMKGFDDLDNTVKELLKNNHYEPMELVAEGLHQEYNHNHLQIDSSTNHFVRAEGPCQFCYNQLFTFPEGCLYGKRAEKGIRKTGKNIRSAARKLFTESHLDTIRNI